MSLEVSKYQTQEDLPCPVKNAQEFTEYLEMRKKEAQLGLIATNTVVELEDSGKFKRVSEFRMLAVMAS